MVNCLYCYKPLVSIGRCRKNGKAHNDWSARRFHKKCWMLGLKKCEKCELYCTDFAMQFHKCEK